MVGMEFPYTFILVHFYLLGVEKLIVILSLKG